MKPLLNRAYALTLASLALYAANAGSAVLPARAAGVPTPLTAASGDTPPPLSATATPRPAGTLIKYSSRILDYREGYVFFTTGDAFHTDPAIKIDDAAGGGPTNLKPVTRTYARATFDSATGNVVELSLATHKLPDEATYDAISRFAVALSTPYQNPELNGGQGFNGKPVLVTFTVEVPSKTPFSDVVYISTDLSSWSPTAYRMDRIDALHYRLSASFNSGTKFLYRYTRGSWRTSERGQNGLEVTPRKFVVNNADVKSKNDTVYSWSDQDEFAPDLGNGSIPTPFNPIPFVTPPRR